jgi:hypothetical protein
MGLFNTADNDFIVLKDISQRLSSILVIVNGDTLIISASPLIEKPVSARALYNLEP